MHVLYLYRDHTVHDRRFLNALANQPVNVTALRLESCMMPGSDWIPPENIKVVSWEGGNKQFRWQNKYIFKRELKRIIRETDPDVIHAGPIDLCGYLAAFSGFKPLVAMSWGYDLLVNAMQKPLSRQRIQYTLDRTAIMLGDCSIISSLASKYGFPVERIISFPWGVDLSTFKPGHGESLRERLGWTNKIIMMSTRNMEMLYGVDVIVDAFIKAVKENDRLRLLMLGDGSKKPLYIQRISSAGLSGYVKFLGLIPENDIAQYFQACDIYLSASHSDGSSVSLLQAMACGIAPLVSDIPGNREWVTPLQNGWLFEDGNSTALAELMVQAANSPQLRAQFGKAAHGIAEKRANWDKNSKLLTEAYKLAVKYHIGSEEVS